ncbi:MAG: IS1182 family transposase [Candidatus Hodarchaeota archaeon]
MRYIEGSDRNQSLLFPEMIDDYVDENNPVRFIDAFVNSLDLLKLGFTHSMTSHTGRKPYNPADLLKLYIYGYLNKIRTSRQLEKATYRNLEVIWLMRKLKPDFKTISDFRKDNKQALKKVCREFIMLCKNLDLFGCELIAIDGSKFSAVNHNNKCYTQNKLKHMLKAIDNKIDEYLSLLDDEDHNEADVKEPTAAELQIKIDSLEQRKAELQQIQQEITDSDASQQSLTDPDSRMMTGTQGADVSYNVQIVTDAKHKLIVDFEVTNDINDENQLYNMASKAKQTLDTDAIEVTTDMGYYNAIEIEKCETDNITCYIPKPKPSSTRDDGRYTVNDFHYDVEHDCYICPTNQQLTYRFQTKTKNKIQKVYEGVTCKGCAHRSKCTSSKANNRRIYRWIHEDILERMQQRMLVQPEKVLQRKCLVEHPFGTIKHWMDQSYFLTRGFEKVTAEFSLSVLAYNIKRVLNIIGVKELVEIMRNITEHSLFYLEKLFFRLFRVNILNFCEL